MSHWALPRQEKRLPLSSDCPNFLMLVAENNQKIGTQSQRLCILTSISLNFDASSGYRKTFYSGWAISLECQVYFLTGGIHGNNYLLISSYTPIQM